MRTLKKKVWAGLALNLATLFIGIWDFGVQDGLNTAVSGLAIAMILSFLLSVTGVVMLLRGKASGGIIAVAGSLIFVPAGLICMLGSLQSRADILREGLTPSSTPPVAPQQEDSAGQQPRDGETEPREEQTAAAKSGETPEIAWRFPDQTGISIIMMVGFACVTLILVSSKLLPALGILGIVLGGLRFVLTRERRGAYVYALYGDRLECVTSRWSSDMVAIPYTDIRDADFRQNDLLNTRIYLRVAATDGEIREISIPLHLLERDDRANATEALEKKLRELGELREEEDEPQPQDTRTDEPTRSDITGAPQPQDAQAEPGETPEAAYRFRDETGSAIFMIGFFSFIALGGLSWWVIFWGAVPGLIMGFCKLAEVGDRHKKFVYALYKDRLECVISKRGCDIVAIPFENIHEGEILAADTASLVVVAEDGESCRISIPLHLIESHKQEEAAATLRRKLQELGVLREIRAADRSNA